MINVTIELKKKSNLCIIKTIKTYLIFGFITVFTAILVLPTLTIVEFYVNQDAIIAEKCIYKNKPELHCNGHCYLKKELNVQKHITTDQENNDLKTFIFTPIFSQKISSIEIEDVFALSKNINQYYNFSYSFLFSSKLLNPPQV